MDERVRQLRAAVVSIGVVMAVGALGVWAPWQGVELPPGVDLGDCGSSQVHTVTVTASLTAQGSAASLAPAGGGVAQAVQVVLEAPVFPSPDAAVQSGSRLTLSMRECDSTGVSVALVPVAPDGQAPGAVPAGGWVPSSLDVQRQRLRGGTASVYVSNPSQLPCGDGASCGSWSGWYFTLEEAGEGSAAFREPVQWGPVGAVELDSRGELQVEVTVDAVV